MMLVKGRYARVTKEGLKTTGLDGMITDLDLLYVTLKLIGSNIKYVRVRLENISIHETVLYRGVGNEIGTLLGDFFTPNMSKNSQVIGKTKFTPHFFKVGDECRFMYNSRVDQGKIVHIDIKDGKVTIDYQGILLTRKMNDIRLPASEPIFVNSPISRPKVKNEMNTSKINTVVPLSRTIYELSWVLDYELSWGSGSTPQKKIFDSFDAMKSFVNELDPKVITNVQYVRFIETETTQVKPVQMFDI